MSRKRKTLKRPCSICRRWFQPDRRVRDRQKTCSSPECRAERKRRSQAEWSAKNPDYWTGRRLAESVRAIESEERTVRAVLDESPSLRRVPEDIAQDAFSPQALVLIAFLVKVLERRAQDEIGRQVAVMYGDFERLSHWVAQDETERRGRSP